MYHMNQSKEVNLKFILENLRKNDKRLTSIRIEGNYFPGDIIDWGPLTDKELIEIGEALPMNNCLESLYLAWNLFSEQAIFDFIRFLDRNTSITSCTLCFIRLTHDKTKIVSCAVNTIETRNRLMKNPNQRYLNFENYYFDASAMQKITHLISKQLIELNLKHNMMGHQGMHVLLQVFADNTSLRSLDLSYNNIGNEGVKVLVPLLAQLPLVKLNLSYNELGNEGGEILAKAIINHPTLVSLILSSNQLQKNAITALANMLRTNTTLIELNLACNHLKGEDVAVLASMLRNNTTLTELDLEFNHLKGEDVRLLFDALRQNNALMKLNLRFNAIGDNGATYLADDLIHNHSITTLNVSQNRISDSGYSKIEEMLATNATIVNIGYDIESSKLEVHNNLKYLLQRNQMLIKMLQNTALEILKAGRIILHVSNHSEIKYMPIKLRRMLLRYLDDQNLLTKNQYSRIFDFAQNRPKRGYFWTKREFFQATGCHYIAKPYNTLSLNYRDKAGSNKLTESLSP